MKSNVKRARLFPLLVVAGVLAWAASASAGADPDADVVHLRKDCVEEDGSVLDDCFETTANLTAWIWGGRSSAPSASDRVLVKMGPGDFDQFVCDASSEARGWVTIIGAGPKDSRFVHVGDEAKGAIDVTGCEELNFQNLGARGNYTGVFWRKDGSSTWFDTEIVGGGDLPEPADCACDQAFGWYDVNGAPTHYVFSSRVVSAGGRTFNWAWNAGNADVWFFGGEILSTHEVAPPSSSNSESRAVRTGGAFRVFGSALRVNVGAATDTSYWSHLDSFSGMAVVTATGDAVFHFHGGNARADASASTQDVDVLGIHAGDNVQLVHTPAASFSLVPGGVGSATRLMGKSSAFESPFLWSRGDSPPAIQSFQGADLFVETDCASGGSCTGGSEPHLMIYSESCSGAGPWFDVATGACRSN